MKDALIVFAKVPVAGVVKTRLTPELSHQEAADLYEAFFLDALDVYAGLGVDVRLYLAPSAAMLDSSVIRGGIAVFEQRGDDLGERMGHAFAESFAAGYERVAVVGTDHPTLPHAFIIHAFECLRRSRSAAIGPAEDGGFYLLAMNDFVPQLFQGMVYSRPDVFHETLHRISAAAVRLTVLPPWYDVDTPADLRRLHGELAEGGHRAPRTKQRLERLASMWTLD